MAPIQLTDKEESLRAISNQLSDVLDERKEFEAKEIDMPSPDKAWEEYLAAPTRPDTGSATLRQYSFQFDRFATWLNKNHPAVTEIRHLTEGIAEEYAKDLRSSGLAAGTFNKHVRLLMLVFQILKKRARLTSNPWENITRRKDSQQGRRELTIEELAQVIHAASDELHTLFALGIYTGLRLGDCCTLRWSEVDIPRGIIIRIPNKTVRGRATPVHIPIHPQLTAILYGVRQTQAERQLLNEKKHKKSRNEESRETVSIPEYVLPKTASDYLARSDTVTDRIQSHFLNCGINVHKKDTGHQIKRDETGLPVRNESGTVKLEHTGKRAVVEVGFHSLRHSFVSLCRAAGTPLAVVEAIVGHSNPAMTRHYTHIGDLAASQAVAALPALGESEKSDKETRLPETSIPELSAILPELQRMNAKNWRKIRDDLVETLKLKPIARMR